MHEHFPMTKATCILYWACSSQEMITLLAKASTFLRLHCTPLCAACPVPGWCTQDNRHTHARMHTHLKHEQDGFDTLTCFPTPAVLEELLLHHLLPLSYSS